MEIPDCKKAPSHIASHKYAFMVVGLYITLHKKMKFSIKDFFSKRDQIRSLPRFSPYLLKKIFNGKLHFLCNVSVFAILTIK